MADLAAQGFLVARKTTPSLSVNVIAAARWSSRVFPTQWFVKIEPLAQRAPSKWSRTATSASLPTTTADLPELDVQHSRLVHLAAAVVGTPHSGVALRGCEEIIVAREAPAKCTSAAAQT